MRSAQGSVKEIEKGKRYRVFVSGGYDPETGKRIRLSKVVRGSRKDAEKAKVELLLKAGREVESPLTLEEYVYGVFLPQRKKELKTTTYEAYEGRLKRHIVPALGNARLCDLTPQNVRRFLETIESPAVKRECRKMLNMVCQSAVYDDHLTSNPVARVKPPKVPRYEPDVLSVEDMKSYISHFRGKRCEAVVLIAMGCGLRRGELVALNVEDIDKETGAIVVDDAYVPTKSGSKHETTKTEAGSRIVHMPRFLLERLILLLPDSGPLARNLDGSRMAPAALTHLYIKERNELPPDVPRVSLKNLRHSSLTLAYDSGADIMEVKERAGHTNISITSRYYVRPKGQRDLETADLISEAFSE